VYIAITKTLFTLKIWGDLTMQNHSLYKNEAKNSKFTLQNQTITQKEYNNDKR
jgi:hypothetical protein